MNFMRRYWSKSEQAVEQLGCSNCLFGRYGFKKEAVK
jgi:hypothetical protein